MMRQRFYGALAGVFLAATAHADTAKDRIVSVGGDITEIIYALGQEHKLVARDVTSNHPAAALDLPDVGYIRRLSPEGVMSVSPSKIISAEGSGPPEAIELLREADIPLVEIPGGFSRDAVGAKIRAVGAALGAEPEAETLAAKIDADIQSAIDKMAHAGGKRVLFILSAAGGRVMAAGRETAPDAMIRMVGGVNAVEGFEGYKPLTDEAIIQTNADVILLMARTGDHAITNDQMRAHPALGAVPAVKNDAIVRMDGMLLTGFSVRTGEAVTRLAEALAKAGQ